MGWLPNPIDWSPIDRGLFLTAIALCVSCSNVAFLSWLSRSSIGDQLNPDFYPVTLGIAMALTAGALSLLLGGLLRRRHVKDWPFLSELLAHGYTLGVLFFSYATGLYTTQIAPLLVAGIAVGLPLLHKGAIARSVVSGLSVLIAILILDELHLIPYAPVFISTPVDAAGRPVGALRYWQMTLLVVSPLLVWVVVNSLLSRWREREAQFQDLAATDSLTGLSTRRQFFEFFEAECVRAQRTGRPVGFIICDLDHFKSVNDTWGHSVGDLTLQHVAAILRAEIRQGIDRVGRFGGEELVVLLPETALEGTIAVAERMREQLQNSEISTANGGLRITASFGVAAREGELAQADLLLEEADNMLYRAKQRGRNRVVWHDDDPAAQQIS
ncbi:MAG: GGDEF domain-containing protein [Chrysiogenetes bacterium]|nr:GGDEF domain-containing protein [Chrysiogenetes bacterium]